ncbi:tyrosine-type recombinase/integrase [Puerhibacterium sp. TATVAM-FAB25]|uniref:tyrosine-type recombinase/integrase n=1 Tax=Puerhibacterium sp. TATVAM-FAB25 TaxID=3093699 RepID=UPI0039781E35
MSRPRTPIGTFGAIGFDELPDGSVRARTRFRDDDGRLRTVQATGAGRRSAERALKAKIATRGSHVTGTGDLTPDSPFPRLVDVWLEDMELEDRLAARSRANYEQTMRTVVMPAFEHYTLREISISKVDRFLKAQARISYGRAKRAKVVLNLVLGLALRYEAIGRNPVAGTARLRQPPRRAKALTLAEIQAVRHAVRSWRRGAGLPGPKPDGQLEAIVEVMLGTSARIGEVLAIRKGDVDVTGSPATLWIAGTVVYLKGAGTYRQDHPKTSSSRRRVAVPSFAAEALRQRLVAVADEEPDHLLFFSRNHTPLSTANVRARLRKVLEEAKIVGVTPHAFRRTVATVLDREASIELAAELLGHSSTAVTKAHYVERDEDVDPVTAQILERLAPVEAGSDSISGDEPSELP